MNISEATIRFGNCSVVECRTVLFNLSSPCFFCLGLEFGAAEDAQADAFTRCASVIPASEYAAPFGLILLSRYRLTEVETVDFLDGDRGSILRGYIRARVTTEACLVTELWLQTY